MEIPLIAITKNNANLIMYFQIAPKNYLFNIFMCESLLAENKALLRVFHSAFPVSILVIS
jgi:hypothetical protein